MHLNPCKSIPDFHRESKKPCSLQGCKSHEHIFSQHLDSSLGADSLSLQHLQSRVPRVKEANFYLHQPRHGLTLWVLKMQAPCCQTHTSPSFCQLLPGLFFPVTGWGGWMSWGMLNCGEGVWFGVGLLDQSRGGGLPLQPPIQSTWTLGFLESPLGLQVLLSMLGTLGRARANPSPLASLVDMISSHGFINQSIYVHLLDEILKCSNGHKGIWANSPSTIIAPDFEGVSSLQASWSRLQWKGWMVLNVLKCFCSWKLSSWQKGVNKLPIGSGRARTKASVSMSM